MAFLRPDLLGFDLFSPSPFAALLFRGVDLGIPFAGFLPALVAVGLLDNGICSHIVAVNAFEGKVDLEEWLTPIESDKGVGRPKKLHYLFNPDGPDRAPQLSA